MDAGSPGAKDTPLQHWRIGKHHICEATDIGVACDKNFFFEANFSTVIQPHKRDLQQLCEPQLTAVSNGKGIGQSQEGQGAIIR